MQFSQDLVTQIKSSTALQITFGTIKEVRTDDGTIKVKVTRSDGSCVGGKTRDADGITDGCWIPLMNTVEEILLTYGPIRTGTPVCVLYPQEDQSSAVAWIMQMQHAASDQWTVNDLPDMILSKANRGSMF